MSRRYLLARSFRSSWPEIPQEDDQNSGVSEAKSGLLLEMRMIFNETEVQIYDKTEAEKGSELQHVYDPMILIVQGSNKLSYNILPACAASLNDANFLFLHDASSDEMVD